MAKKRLKGKLGDMLGGSEETKTPTSDDLKKMLEETETKGKEESKKEVLKEERKKKKVSTEIDAELYDTFRKLVRDRGMKVNFVLERFMRDFIEDK